MVVADVREQNSTVERVVSAFDKATVVDRRERPTHGYRAVHVIPVVADLPVEIQIRTALQHRWAELSEKLSDLVDPGIKYGRGASELQEALSRSSAMITKIEGLEIQVLQVRSKLAGLDTAPTQSGERLLEDAQREVQKLVAHADATLDSLMTEIREIMEGT